MRVPLVLCGLALLAGCGGPPDAWAVAPPALPAPSRPDAADVPVPSPDAVAAIERLRGRLYGRPFYAVASLTVRRPGGDRELLVRLHYRGPDHVLVRLAGSPRDDGTTALRTADGVHVWFPRAGLRLELPPTLGTERLAGSDFAFADLLALGTDAENWVPVAILMDDAESEARDVVILRPAHAATALHREVRLWLARSDGLPLGLEVESLRGEVVRTIEMRRGTRAEYPLPIHWTARTHGDGGGVSELRFRMFEADPPVDPALFTLEGLELWR